MCSPSLIRRVCHLPQEDPNMSQPNLVFEKLVWTVEEVARELGISERHVYKLISQRRIPYSKIGRRTVFLRSKVTEWLLKGGTK